MLYLNSKQFRELINKQTFKINAVFGPYRSGYLPTSGFRTFKYQSDGSLMEQKWNKEDGKFELLPVREKIDKDFYKNYKKAFDLVIELEKPISFKNYKGEEVEDYEFTVSGISSSKIKDLLVPAVIEDMPEGYDWEDKEIVKLKDLIFRLSVSGEGLDTRYIFSPKTKFNSYGAIKELDMDDIPF